MISPDAAYVKQNRFSLVGGDRSKDIGEKTPLNDSNPKVMIELKKPKLSKDQNMIHSQHIVNRIVNEKVVFESL